MKGLLEILYGLLEDQLLDDIKYGRKNFKSTNKNNVRCHFKDSIKTFFKEIQNRRNL